MHKRKVIASLTAVLLMAGMSTMPTTSRADPAGAAKCIKGSTKFLNKAVKRIGKAAVRACAVGGSNGDFESQLNVIAVPKLNKVLAKLRIKYDKKNCASEDADLLVGGDVTAGSLRQTYEVLIGRSLKAFCDGIATPLPPPP